MNYLKLKFNQVLSWKSVIMLFYGLLLMCGCVDKPVIQQQVQVVAHRGDWKHAPENSIQGIENCIRMGVDMVEIDLALTKDGVLILMHDKTLDRTSTGAGNVIDQTLAEIRQLYLKDHSGNVTKQRIPTFEEVMNACKGRIEVFVDKGYPLMAEAYDVLKQTNTHNQAHFLGFVSGEKLAIDYPALYQKVSYMPLVLPTDTIEAFLKTFDEINTTYSLFSFKEENPDFLAKVPEVAAKHSFAMATTQSSYYCAGHTDSVSITNKEAGWGWIIDQGFNAICTDEPEKLIEYLKERGLH